MKSLELDKIYSVAEYFSLEEESELRHEFINGNLIEMSRASREHHFICQNILLALLNSTKPLGFNVFIENMKVKIPHEDLYFYPDIFITREAQTNDNKYVQFQPELIVEVLSESSRVRDLTDKFIQYRKIETLNYYLLVEPEKYLVLLNFKNEKGDWEMISFTQKEEIIALPKLNITLSLEDIYKK
ncbi:MAG: Uma2 family endonuclease [Bacteroidota bacterium]